LKFVEGTKRLGKRFVDLNFVIYLLNERSFLLIRRLFVVWCRLKPFEQFVLCTESVFWTLNRLVPIEVQYMERNPECFHQKP